MANNAGRVEKRRRYFTRWIRPLSCVYGLSMLHSTTLLLHKWANVHNIRVLRQSGKYTAGNISEAARHLLLRRRREKKCSEYTAITSFSSSCDLWLASNCTYYRHFLPSFFVRTQTHTYSHRNALEIADGLIRYYSDDDDFFPSSAQSFPLLCLCVQRRTSILSLPCHGYPTVLLFFHPDTKADTFYYRSSIRASAYMMFFFSRRFVR